MKGKGFLLILDGFDEMPISVVKNENSLVMKLIKGFCLPKSNTSSHQSTFGSPSKGLLPTCI